MGILFQSDKFEIRDNNRNVKFSTDRKMPHILYGPIAGSIPIPQVRNGQSYVERKDELVIQTNSNINTDDPFIIAFFKITGGPADTGGKLATGGGSFILRTLRRVNTGEFLGSSILDVIIEPGQLKLSCAQNLDRRQFGGGTYGSPLSPDIREQDVVGDDPVSIEYTVYYGRFR
jgi:hypothetical protein